MANNTDKTKYVGTGTGFLGLLTLLFIHHKLIGTITWSWWWVLSPLWIAILAALVIFGIAVVIALLMK